MEQIFKNYLINKTHDKEPNITTPKIDVKKKDYDTIVKIVDNSNDKPIIPKRQKR